MLDGHFEVGEHLPDDLAEVAFFKRLRAAGHPRELQEILDERLHAAGGILHPTEVIPALLAERVATFRLKAVAKGLNFPERLLEIVGGDGGKILELLIGALQLSRQNA